MAVAVTDAAGDHGHPIATGLIQHDGRPAPCRHPRVYRA